MQIPPPNHEVRIDLTLETLTDGRISTRQILSADIDVPDATTSMIALAFAPAVEGLGGTLIGTLGALDGQGPRMVANLMINGETRKSQDFIAPGSTAPGSAGFLGDGSEQPLTTALFLTVTSIVPGQPDHAETRTILDLVPPRARLEVDTGLDPAALLPVGMGERYPAALESLRMMSISNGGASPRLMAALNVDHYLGLAEFLDRANQDLLDGWDLLWANWRQVRRLDLAAETVLRAHPPHNGTCLILDRPRVTTLGIANAGDGRILQWLDWTIDGYGLSGGDAAAQAELRLWHGALQGALETEALMLMTLSPDDLIPPDEGPMRPVTPEQTADLGGEAAADQARGYILLADAGMDPGSWWRVDPATGAADARALMHGNTRWIEWGAERASIARGGAIEAMSVSAEEQAIINSTSNNRLYADAVRQLEAAEAAAAQPRCGGNEYMIFGTCVSIPAAIATVVTVASAIAYALLG